MKYGLWLLLVLWPMAGFTNEAGLAELLGRIRHNGSAEFRYEEIRKLELASSPWNGQGYMLSGADGSLVKLQLQPTRVIMVISRRTNVLLGSRTKTAPQRTSRSVWGNRRS